MTATQFGKVLEEKHLHPNKIYKSKGNWVLRFGFFYTHGQSAESKKKLVENALGIVVTSAREVWNVWPKDSYWEIQFPVSSVGTSGIRFSGGSS